MSNGTRLLRPLLHQRPLLARPQRQPHKRSTLSNQHRTFIENPFQGSIQTLTASRTLPYQHDLLYTIIADIGQYSTFLPYCLSSTVTKWSKPTPVSSKKDNSSEQKEVQWPEEATLTIGWQNVRESFTSRVYCVPGRIVEAVSGETLTTLPEDEIQHHSHSTPDPSSNTSSGSSSNGESGNSLLTHLRTRWTLRPYPYKPPPVPSLSSSAPSPKQPARPEDPTTQPAREQTEVSLHLEYAFANPVYGGLSKAVAPRVAEMMVGAFEERVKGMLR
ncbi:MAG: hypothetical protein Q9165_001686 [Trypethelium subeluteriae]